MDIDYLKKLKEMREAEIKEFHQDERNLAAVKEGEFDDEPFEASTFLYIRAFDGDNGSRPISPGQTYCLSPDLELYLNGAVVDTDRPLLPETHYTVQVTVTNDGDLDCNLCTVDLYLCNLSLGFNTKGGQLIGISNARIDAHSKTTVEFPFTTTKDMEGHRCMFARAYSLVSHDYPTDLTNFNTYADRHIGQQNLNIVRQGGSFDFEINRQIGGKARDVHIVFQQELDLFDKYRFMKQKFVLSKRQINADQIKLYTGKEQLIRPDIIKKIAKGRVTPSIFGKLNPKVPNLNEKVLETKLSYLPITKRIEQDRWLHRIESGTNTMKIEIPKLGLNNNEAVPMKLSAVDPETGESIGEITVIVIA